MLLKDKLIGKIPDACNAKELYQSFIRRKKRKSVKQSEIITHQWKNFENSNFVDIKLVITEHPEPLHNLFTSIRQAIKVGSNSSLYSDKKKIWMFLKRKKYKNKKTRA